METPSVIEVIRQERKRRLWSVRKLAAKAGLSPAYVSQIENGNRPLTPKATRKIADAFRMPPYALLSAAGFIPPADVAKAREMAARALAEAPEIVAKALGEGDYEKREWLVVDYLYRLGHDVYATGWDGGAGNHADWRILEPDAPAPFLERIKPEIEAWREAEAKRLAGPLEGWDELLPQERRMVQNFVWNILDARRSPEDEE